MRKRIVSVMSATLLAIVVLVFGGATAQAAAPTTTCGGAGWTEVDGVELWKLGGAPSYGRVVLFYGNGYNCTVTYKNVSVGTPTYVSAFVCRQSDGTCLIEGGDATHQVWTGALNAPGTCVKWGGGVSDVYGWREYREIGWGHCG